VDAHHGDSDGPCCLANTEAQIAVVGVDVSALLGCLDDLDDGLEDAFVEVAFLEFAEQLGRVSLSSIYISIKTQL